jgi:hypothetical protein
MGHQLGFLDEYVDPNTVNRGAPGAPGVTTDNSLMGDFWLRDPATGRVVVDPATGLPVADPATTLHDRHLGQLGGDIDAARAAGGGAGGGGPAPPQPGLGERAPAPDPNDPAATTPAATATADPAQATEASPAEQTPTVAEPQTTPAEQPAQTPAPAGGQALTRLTPADIRPGMDLDPSRTQVFRGGSDMTLKPGEVRIDRATNMVKTSHGVSLESNPSGLGRFGGANQIKTLPPDLKIIQRGRLEHFEIVPRQPMTVERFQQLLNSIEFW